MTAGAPFVIKERPQTTCGQCPKFRPLPPDPNHLGAPRAGECFGAPPATCAVGNGQFISMTIRVPADRPACAVAELLAK